MYHEYSYIKKGRVRRHLTFLKRRYEQLSLLGTTFIDHSKVEHVNGYYFRTKIRYGHFIPPKFFYHVQCHSWDEKIYHIF